MQEVRFEPFDPKDLESLYALFEDGWDFSRFTDHKGIQKHLYRGDMYQSLLYQNHIEAAYVDGELAGVLMAKIKGAKPKRRQKIRFVWPLLVSGLYLGFHSRRSRKLLASVRRFEKVWDKLLKDTKKKFDAELSIFITHSRYRGLGLGKKLMENFEDLLRQKGLVNYYLFSDTESNYGFYEHMGFWKEAEKTIKTGDADKSFDITLFVYSKTL